MANEYSQMRRAFQDAVTSLLSQAGVSIRQAKARARTKAKNSRAKPPKRAKGSRKAKKSFRRR
jgi:hypothetical protein